MLFKELEWGINLSTNTIFLTYDIDVDALYPAQGGPTLVPKQVPKKP